MARSPLKIKDYQMNISSTRKELMDEENEKIIGKRGFIFTTYKTEKQRIEEYLKEKDTINAKINLLQNTKINESYNINLRDSHSPKSNQNHTKSSFAQPSMRFKARTDLERIAETVNKYSFGRADYHIVNKQLKNLELNISKKAKDSGNEEILPDYNSRLNKRLILEQERNSITRKEKDFVLKQGESEEKNKNSKSNLVTSTGIKTGNYSDFNSQPSDRKKKGKKNIDNSQAKHLLSDLHKKTHFKGASGYMLFKDSSIPNNSATLQRSNSFGNSSNSNTSKLKVNNYDYVNIFNMYATISNNKSITDQNFSNLNTSTNNFGNFSNYLTTSNSNSNLITSSNLNSTKSNGKNFNNTTTKFRNNNNFNLTQTNSYNKTNYVNTKSSGSSQTGRRFNQKTIRDNYCKTISNSENKLEKFLNDPELSDQIINTNPLIYNLNEQPFRKNIESEKIDYEKLNYIKDLAFKKKEEVIDMGFFGPKMRNSSKKLSTTNLNGNGSGSIILNKNSTGNASSSSFNFVPKLSMRGSVIQHNPQTFLQRFKESLMSGIEFDYSNKKSDEDKITIDGEEFLKSDIDKIAKKVLTGCNFVHKKNKNNDTELSCGDGKLMFTCGMTIKDFMKKHHLHS